MTMWSRMAPWDRWAWEKRSRGNCSTARGVQFGLDSRRRGETGTNKQYIVLYLTWMYWGNQNDFVMRVSNLMKLYCKKTPQKQTTTTLLLDIDKICNYEGNVICMKIWYNCMKIWYNCMKILYIWVSSSSLSLSSYHHHHWCYITINKRFWVCH